MPMLIDVAELAGLAVEGPLYGAFTSSSPPGPSDPRNERSPADRYPVLPSIPRCSAPVPPRPRPSPNVMHPCASARASSGVFLCLFCTSAYDLLTRRARGDARLNWPMVFTGVSLILLATARFTLDVAYLFIAFFGKDPRAARIAFLRDVHVQLFIAKHATLLTSLLIGDCFMVGSGGFFIHNVDISDFWLGISMLDCMG